MIQQQLKALTVFPEDRNSIPSTHVDSQPSVTPWDPMLWEPPCALDTQVVRKHTCRQNTHVHKMNLNLKGREMGS